MDRRKSLKTLALGTLSANVLLEACNPKTKQKTSGGTAAETGGNGEKAVWAGKFEKWEEDTGRQAFEEKRDKQLMTDKFFTDQEMKTIAVLSDIIIPKDDHSGSATDAGVPDFIEFIVKDMPQHKTPMRGGLRWLDVESLKRFDKSFTDLSSSQQIEIVEDIAYPGHAKPGMEQGVAFFTLMRNLTASGFYSSKIGIADIGYKGNTPTVWDGVPDDVLKQYGLSYDQKTLQQCVKKEDHDKLFVFDS
jgi:hypothetical protein